MAARLAHRHVVRLLEVGETEHGIHLTFEYIGGGTLADLLDRHPQRCLPIPTVVRVVAQVVQLGARREDVLEAPVRERAQVAPAVVQQRREALRVGRRRRRRRAAPQRGCEVAPVRARGGREAEQRQQNSKERAEIIDKINREKEMMAAELNKLKALYDQQEVANLERKKAEMEAEAARQQAAQAGGSQVQRRFGHSHSPDSGARVPLLVLSVTI